MMTTLDIATVRTFLLVAELKSFTRAAETIGTTQAAVSMKLQRLESALDRRLLERSPRSVEMTSDGLAFLEDARFLLEAHERALRGSRIVRPHLRLGISDHAAGAELVPMLETLRAVSTDLTLSVTIGFSRDLIETFDSGNLDALIVRQEAGRRGGEHLITDQFGWFAAPRLKWSRSEPLKLATLASPCGVRAIAVRSLQKSLIPFDEVFVGGGLVAIVAAVQAGLAVTPMARRIAPPGLLEIGQANKLPLLGPSKVILHSRVSDSERLAALRLLAATFRRVAAT